MKNPFACFVCFGLLALAAGTQTARAQEAPAPLGCWRGAFADGSGSLAITVTASGAGGYQVSGGRPTTGQWTWTPTSRGGILTLHYINGGFHTRAYYSVTYLNARTILLSDPYFKVVLHRL